MRLNQRRFALSIRSLLLSSSSEVSCDHPGSLTSIPYCLKFLKEDGFVPVLLRAVDGSEPPVGCSGISVRRWLDRNGDGVAPHMDIRDDDVLVSGRNQNTST